MIRDLADNIVSESVSTFMPPRKWTFYVMVSSHFDLGLPNAPYIQREESARIIESARQLCIETADRPSESQYRYVMEGTWVWNNYCETLPSTAINESKKMIREGQLGVCATVAGNHIHTYGLEELCRSTYSKAWLKKQGIDCKTMTMIDIPGLPWSMVQPYADAGYENVIFAPNNWGPHLSTVWTLDHTKPWVINNPESCGGGSRIDVRYDSNLPLLFYWQGKGDRRLLVWASPQYGVGAEHFGISAFDNSVERISVCMAANLPLLEERYPYDVWLMPNYEDNMQPEMRFTDAITEWNRQFAFPQIRTLGDPDEPFTLVKERYGDQIPVLSGDITSGWDQHPLAAAAVLTDSLSADRALPTAEKLATLAAVYTDYEYPSTEFESAWASLIMNDEHSYGVGEYYGRDVAETWMQHKDWVQKANETAKRETQAALWALAEHIPGEGKRILVFNPTAQPRREHIVANGEYIADIPSFGYRILDADSCLPYEEKIVETDTPPVVENAFYRVVFAENGSLAQIFDKELQRTINSGICNELLYTRDNHKNFHQPIEASFTIQHGQYRTVVTVHTKEPVSGAELVQTVTLPTYEKRIDLDNHLYHVQDMIVSDRKDRSRYDRFLYFAFPFEVENCRRYCDLGGVEAEYGVDLTGHSTDVYMAAHEYCCAENDRFGVGLIQLDSQLIEFDHIHADKTDFGNPGSGSAIFSYVANAWFHHKHLPGGNSICYRFRYTITSFAGSHHVAGLPQMAERIANPVITMELQDTCSGSLPPKEASFLKASDRFVNLKRAADGNGLIIRLYRDQNIHTESECTPHIDGYTEWLPVSMDESEPLNDPDFCGFYTMRSPSESTHISVRTTEPSHPLSIGGVYTGLISEPRATSVFDGAPGTMYLLWGKCADEELSHYELYRSIDSHFAPDKSNLIARIEPENYVVGRYVDSGLSANTRYFYKVRTVSKNGQEGPFSNVFSGLCRE